MGERPLVEHDWVEEEETRQTDFTGWKESPSGRQGSGDKRWERRGMLAPRGDEAPKSTGGGRLAPERGTKVSKEEVKWGHTRWTPRMCQPPGSVTQWQRTASGINSTWHMAAGLFLGICADWSCRYLPSNHVRYSSNSTVSNWTLLRNYPGTLKNSHSIMNSGVLALWHSIRKTPVPSIHAHMHTYIHSQ